MPTSPPPLSPAAGIAEIAGTRLAHRQLRVAIVHYWLVGMRGGERVLEALCEMFPEADIYTHVYVPERISDRIRRHRITTSFIARLPMARRLYTHYLPLMPLALEQFDLTHYDLVISSESGPTKGVLTRPDALHVCYCHTPMRYAWSGYHAYRKRTNNVIRLMMLLSLHRIRQWDLATAFRVDHFVANSHNVASRIRKYYHRDAAVIHPPVDTAGYDPAIAKEDFYLLVSQLVPYKRTEIAVEAFNRLDRRLVIIGRGSEFRKLRRMAGPNIELLGWQDDTVVRDHFARCRALIFPADEDFGIVPVEAMSAGRPVIALRRGGALETVVADRTGVFFNDPTSAALIDAVRRFEILEPQFDPAHIAAYAQSFSQATFRARMEELLVRHLDTHGRAQAAWHPSQPSAPVNAHPAAAAAE